MNLCALDSYRIIYSPKSLGCRDLFRCQPTERIASGRRDRYSRIAWSSDTVEEKALHLQKTKRDPAAIISEDNSVICDLRREDLKMLLS